VQQRSVERAVGRVFTAVDSLDLGDATYLPCDEAVVVERDVRVFLAGLGDFSERVELGVAGCAETELLRDTDADAHADVVAGRLSRHSKALTAALRIDAETLPGPYGVRRLRLRLENHTRWASTRTLAPDRPDALRHSLVAAHLLVGATHGAFVSQLDPPEWARGYVEENTQVGCFPVLAAAPGERDLVLASPIILYDHPQVAPESATQFCDATEMDEMLTLRTLTLTDAEKRLVRGSDPRAAALVDQIDQLPPDILERLHGAIRGMSSSPRPAVPGPDQLPAAEAPWWDPGQDLSVDPDHDVVVVDGVAVARGVSVRLRPGGRGDDGHRADAQDMFLEGRLATVQAVLFDVDGNTHLAVALDDLLDDGFNPHGRFLYFAPSEVEPIRVDA
jgi:hypothetical protein